MVMPLAGEGGCESGDEVIATLLYQHFERLLAVLRQAGLDGEAEDIAQETLFRAWAHRNHLDFDRSIWPWLRTVAFNLVADRHKSQRQVVLTDPHALPDSEIVPVDVDESLLVQETLNRLPERQRQVMRFHYLEDRDPAETGRELGIDNRAAFNQLLYRARISFKSAYEWTRGLVALGVRRLERLGGELVTGVRRAGTRLSPSEPILSAGLQQLASGMVALLVSLSGPSFPLPPHQSEGNAPSWPSGTRRVHGERGGTGVTPRSSTDNESTARRPDHMDAGSSPPRVDPQQLANDALTPNHDVKNPEDARITSIAFSPSYRHDGTVFAAGVTRCNGSFCPSVLFRSLDGGKRWVRLPSAGFYGVSLLLPPLFGVGDKRIFAMGAAGLQVSADGGKSFAPAAVAGANQTIGSAVMSPAFNAGDPTILIGAQTLMRYRDDLRTVEAVLSTSIPGPLEPAFAPDYETSDRILIGGMRFDGALGQAAAAVFRCTSGVCESALLGGDRQSPRIRLTPVYERRGLVHAFTQWGVFESNNAGVSFREIDIGWTDDMPITDLSVGDRGTELLVTVVSVGPSKPGGGGVYLSKDGGNSWRRLAHPLLDRGAHVVSELGGVILIGLRDGGIACSKDDGRSWARRCW